MPRTLAHTALVSTALAGAITLALAASATAQTHTQTSSSVLSPAAAALASTRYPQPRAVPYPGTIQVAVDATDIERKVFRVRETLPVKPGRLTLLYPRWLPGQHGPYGEVDRIAGLQISANGQPLRWERDPVEPQAFHLEVPAGVNELQLEFQHLSPTTRDAGRVVMAPNMLNLQWNAVVLYPAGHVATQIRFAPRVKLPAGWQWAGALRGRNEPEGWVQYDPVTLDTLIDSPLYAGRYAKAVPLDAPGAPKPVVLHLVADDPSQLEASDAQLQAHRELVTQADRLFGARHFRHYDFLLSLSDTQGGIGLEHHESSENGVRPRYFKDWDKATGPRGLLPHEYVHSWDGKFRRPADLWTPDYNSVPMRNSLLWVYEGQTQYWGRVLTARSGLSTLEQARQDLARVAAWTEHRSGRQWRPLQDTTTEGTLAVRRDDKQWSDWQRSVDYYDESALIWLEADVLIREKSGGARSLDDFARAFFGNANGPEVPGPDGRVQPQTYTFEDVVAALDKVQPNDWAGFLRTRLDRVGMTPMEGLAKSGWKLVYSDKASDADRADDERRGVDFVYSLGLRVGKDENELREVAWNSPAFQAGLAPGLKLVAVNGDAYKPERLSEAIRGNRDGKRPIELLVRDGERYRTVKIDYRDGLRYPRLERLPEVPDRLTQILEAKRG
jgi:predicted metalloprotease with PDZ domain